MTVQWTDEAIRQLRSVETYLRAHGVDPARTVRRIERASERLGLMPRLGRPARQRDVRIWVVTGTRYLIVYSLRNGVVVVLALFHERQQRPTSFQSD